MLTADASRICAAHVRPADARTYERTDGRRCIPPERADLRLSNARVQALLVVGLVLHAIRTPKPKAPVYIGRHRLPDPERNQRPGNGIAWWIWTAVAAGYAWLTWRMAVIELPLMVALGVAMTFALAYTAGRNHR